MCSWPTIICIIYFDDSQMYQYYHEYYLLSNILRGLKLIQRNTQGVAYYAIKNELKRNLNKSKVIILGSETFVTSPELIKNVIKNLKVWLMPSLDSSRNVNSILKKV